MIKQLLHRINKTGFYCQQWELAEDQQSKEYYRRRYEAEQHVLNGIKNLIGM